MKLKDILLNEAGGIIDKTRAKKIAKQARKLIARIKSVPEYKTALDQYNNKEISKTAFYSIIRKEIVTDKEAGFMHKLAHHSQVSTSSWNYTYDTKEYAWSMVSRSNIARELYDVGLAYNQYAKTGPYASNTSPASVYRPGFSKMKPEYTFN
jgi:hypothetical protein